MAEQSGFHKEEEEEEEVIIEDEEHFIGSGDRDDDERHNIEEEKEEEEEEEEEEREGEGTWRRGTGERRELFPTRHDEDDVTPLISTHKEEEEEEIDNNDIILELRPKGLPRRKESLANLISENRKAMGIVPSPLSVAVNNLSLSVTVTVAKTEQRNILQDVRERLRIDERKTVKKMLLQNVSFFIKENMMLLILGPPGCGKTSLMRVLAHNVYGHQTGDIFFNRKPIDPDLHHRMASFVGQEDEHLPALTVRQTLQFAGDLQLATEYRPGNADVAGHVDLVMQILGLTHRADTIVGNAMMRGVSGGEKKRVTIGVELMKNPRLLLLDESTTGLDTATSIELGKFCRTIADNMIPVAAALLQPPLKLYRKFDHILLLNDGEVTFFGPRARVLSYFESIGFRCPANLNPADYLVSLMTHPEDYRIQGHPRIVEHVRDFADVYLESSLFNEEILPQIYGEFPPEKIPVDYGLKTVRIESDGEKTVIVESDDDEEKHRDAFDLKPATDLSEKKGMIEMVDVVEDERRESGGRGEREREREHRGSRERRERETEIDDVRGVITAEEEKKRLEFERKVYGEKYPRSTLFQIYALVRRGWQQQINFPAFFIIMSVYSLFLAVFYGTLFFQLGYTQTDVSLRYGIVFNIVLVMGFKSAASNDTVFRERKVFEMQKTKRYYSTLPYWIAGLLNYIPMLAIDISLFATVAYWLIGLSAAEDGARFVFLILVGVLLTLACDGWIRMIAQLNTDFTTSQGVGPFSMGSLMLFAGFFRPIHEMPWAVRWLAYVSPFRWAYEALVINEMANQKFYCTDDQLVPPSSSPYFNLSYSQGGFEGYQTCPVTNGNAILVMFHFPTDPNWKWYCALILLGIVIVFQFGVFLLFKYVSHQKPPTRRITKSPSESEDDKIEIESLGVEEEVTMIGEGDLQMQRDSKPRVTVEFTDVSYSVKGAKSAEDIEDEEKAEALRVEQSLANVKGEEEKGAEEKYPCGLAPLAMCLRAREEKSYISLLDRISGRVEPGMMLALMGPSGAGKSTLMDVIAGRKTGGKTTGSILFNGRPRDDNFSRYTGYCEQQDLHMEYATVYEAVRLAALTRLPASWSNETKIANVLEIIERLRLSSAIHTLVRDLRAEQRKRLTVAVELVTNPSVLFLDEPTSGLDTTEAAEIMKVVKEETHRGMSVCCTIHQPSSQIFSLFTHILLLKTGGEMVYFGKTTEMLSYFETKLGLKCPIQENPADFALEVVNKKLEKDPARVWLESEERFLSMETKREDSDDVSQKENRLSRAWTAEYESKYPASFYSQCRQLVGRSVKSIYRRPQDFRVRFWRNLILGVVSGGVFYDLGNTQSSAGSRLAAFFFLMIIATFNAFTQITMISLDRPAYYRERLAGSYRALAYLVGIVIPDLPFVLMNFLLYAIPQYFMSGLRLNIVSIVYYFICGFGSSILSFALVQFLAIISFNPGLASLLGGVTITLSNMLAGFFIPKSQIPVWWIWGYYTSFVRYPLEGMAVNELANLPLFCDNNVGAIPVFIPTVNQTQFYCPLENGNQLLAKYDMSESHKWPYLGITFGIYFLFLLGCWYGLAKVIHINR